MLHFEKSNYRQEAEVFKALGHPTRLWIVDQLADGEEHCVCEFVEGVQADFSTVSKHLHLLKQAGLIADEKRGKQVFYRMNCTCVSGFISCVRSKICQTGKAKGL